MNSGLCLQCLLLNIYTLSKTKLLLDKNKDFKKEGTGTVHLSATKLATNRSLPIYFLP